MWRKSHIYTANNADLANPVHAPSRLAVSTWHRPASSDEDSTIISAGSSCAHGLQPQGGGVRQGGLWCCICAAASARCGRHVVLGKGDGDVGRELVCPGAAPRASCTTTINPLPASSARHVHNHTPSCVQLATVLIIAGNGPHHSRTWSCSSRTTSPTTRAFHGVGWSKPPRPSTMQMRALTWASFLIVRVCVCVHLRVCACVCAYVWVWVTHQPTGTHPQFNTMPPPPACLRPPSTPRAHLCLW